jgi:hypothetical protein
MACNNQLLISTSGVDGYALPTGNNSITSQWLDKRSSKAVFLSFVLSGANAPTGTVLVQTSGATEKPGGTYGAPGSQTPVDAQTYPGSSTAITTTGITSWDITTSARWVRVVYTSSSNVAGLTVNCYGNAPFDSQ